MASRVRERIDDSAACVCVCVTVCVKVFICVCVHCVTACA